MSWTDTAGIELYRRNARREIFQKQFRQQSPKRPSANQSIPRQLRFESKTKNHLHCATPQEFAQYLLWFRFNVTIDRYIQVLGGILLLHWGREKCLKTIRASRGGGRVGNRTGQIEFTVGAKIVHERVRRRRRRKKKQTNRGDVSGWQVNMPVWCMRAIHASAEKEEKFRGGTTGLEGSARSSL
jgi:hypothetical protein